MHFFRLSRALGVLVGLTLAGTVALPGQGFDSGSDGSDGALTFPTGLTVFDPAASKLDRDGDNVFHFTTITVPAGATVKLRADKHGGDGKPVVWLASGEVRILGTLDLNGENGHESSGVIASSIAGAGGYGGGVGGTAVSPAQPGNGPGSGRAGINGAGPDRTLGGNAGHAVAGVDDTTRRALPGGVYGNRFLLPLRGGSGGGGGGHIPPTRDICCEGVGTGGGAGGGAILIASSTSIEVAAGSRIAAKGGLPGTTLGQSNRRGGAGSGGAIRLVAPVVHIFGTVEVGDRNTAPGRIRVEAFERTLSGTITPNTGLFLGSPGPLFLPASAPGVRVTRVASVKAPAKATGSFADPDVTVEETEAISIELAATNIPPGTRIRVNVRSEDGPGVDVMSSPLKGTRESSTASVQVTLPRGFTRLFLSASWTP